MRRILFTTVLLAAVAILCDAQIVTQQQAREKAIVFMRQKGMPTHGNITAAPLSHTISGQNPIYVFNATGGKGFVVVSGDERTEAILGYVTESEFDETRLPETMRRWLIDYANEIDALREGQIHAQPLHIGSHDPIGKLLTSVWAQGRSSESGNAYNQLCPTVDGIHCVAGCVATAMAQVMRYQKWPQSYTTAIPAYTSNETVGQLSGLSKIKFDWANMLDRYDEGQSTQECKAVAQLLRYCGQAVQTDYGTDASSASLVDVAMALRTYFGYDVNTRYVRRSDYSAAAWDKLIYGELQKGRPVVYHGSNPGGGHAFVCDGYGGQGFYHINWGWNGYCNGYFKLAILNPKGGGTGSSSSNCGYSMYQGAVVGIQKPTGDTDEQRTLSVEDYTRDGHTLSVKYGNRTGLSGTFDYGFAYQKASDTGSTYKVRKTTDDFEPYDARTYSLNLDQMNLDDDVYRFYPYSILNGCSWYHVLCDRKKYFEVTFNGGQVTNITYHPRASLMINSVVFTGNKIVNQPQEVTITVSNDGEEYNDVFYLFASQTNNKGEAVDKVCLPLETGEEEQTSLYFTPTSTGKWKVWLDILEDGSNNLSPWEVDIKSAPTSKSKLSLISLESSNTTDAIIKAKVKNNSTEGYYMPIYCYLFEDSKTYNIAYDKTGYLNIGPKETAEMDFCFESLVLGNSYIVGLKDYPYHYSNDTEWLGDYTYFTVTTTDITTTEVQQETSADVYSLSGVLVRKDARNLDGLPKGVYIINGKKRVHF